MVTVYTPTEKGRELPTAKPVRLTDARALLLYVLRDLTAEGEFISEFSAEKVCYFLQKFGAQKYFKLVFNPHTYGPYSGKVRYVLHGLNGKYLTGYEDMDKKSFEPVFLVHEAYEEVVNYIAERDELKEIATKAISFLSGFYGDFSLELLSSVDYLRENLQSEDIDEIIQGLATWNERKGKLFANREYVAIALQRLRMI